MSTTPSTDEYDYSAELLAPRNRIRSDLERTPPVNPNIPTRPLPLTFRPFGPPISVEGDAGYGSPYGYRDPATLQARDVCPHCRCETARHRFTTPDGVWLETHHCREHGDIAPMRSVIVNQSIGI